MKAHESVVAMLVAAVALRSLRLVAPKLCGGGPVAPKRCEGESLAKRLATSCRVTAWRRWAQPGRDGMGGESRSHRRTRPSRPTLSPTHHRHGLRRQSAAGTALSPGPNTTKTTSAPARKRSLALRFPPKSNTPHDSPAISGYIRP